MLSTNTHYCKMSHSESKDVEMIENSDQRVEEVTRSEQAGRDERSARIRVKNRRQMYLDSNPSYFDDADLELAGKSYLDIYLNFSNIVTDPLLYDRCIRRFQTPAQREAEGKAKGYSKTLEADLYRSEAKLAALAGKPLDRPSNGAVAASEDLTYVPGPDGEVLPEDPDEIPKDREEGLERWKEAMTLRFLQGKDGDFEYEAVDESEEWDVVERQDAEEKWFEDEEPEWASDDGKKGRKANETGIQDF